MIEDFYGLNELDYEENDQVEKEKEIILTGKYLSFFFE